MDIMYCVTSNGDKQANVCYTCTDSFPLAQEAGYSYVEQNASSNRNKSTLHGQVGAQVGSLSIDSFMGGAKGGVASGRRHVLIMDEVDGMAGNEDRGGMQVSTYCYHSTIVLCIRMQWE